MLSSMLCGSHEIVRHESCCLGFVLSQLFWQVLERKMGMLLERLETMGLPHLEGHVVSSVPAGGALQDQVRSACIIAAPCLCCPVS